MLIGMNGNIYYVFNDMKIYQCEDVYVFDGMMMFFQMGDVIFFLQERKYKNIYFIIFIMLIFCMVVIGDFCYYGKFGVRIFFLLKLQMNDKGVLYVQDGMIILNKENNGMCFFYGSDVLFLCLFVGLVGGIQWNFIGNMVLFVEFGFYYVFMLIYNIGSKVDNMMFMIDYNFDFYNNYYCMKVSQI